MSRHFKRQNKREDPISSEEALALLKTGNERFVQDKPEHPHQDSRWRKGLVERQVPYATIIACSDSRIIPEVIFDAGLGDLFLVRVAAHVCTPEVLGSLEYASAYLTSRLIVVLGHQSCGAISEAVHHLVGHAQRKNAHEGNTAGIQRLVDRLRPAVNRVTREGQFSSMKEAIELSVRENVRLVEKQILARSPLLRRMQNKKELKLVRAYYSLDKGTVEFDI